MAEPGRSIWALAAFAFVGVLGMGGFMVAAEWVFDGSRRSTLAVGVLSLVLVAAVAVVLMRSMGLRSGRGRLKAVAAVAVGALLVPLVVLAALLAPGGAFGHGPCDLSPSQATWVEPGLYASVPDRDLAGMDGVHEDPAGGFPFHNDSAQDALPGHRLLHIGYRPLPGMTAEDLAVSLHLSPTGELSARAGGSEPERDDGPLRAAFLAFVHNTTTQTGEAVERSWSSFVANRTETGRLVAARDGSDWVEESLYTYHVGLTGPWRLAALFNATVDPAALVGVEVSPALSAGEASVAGGPWSFRFALPSWRVAAQPGETLRVDSRDVVTVQASWGELTDQEYLQQINSTFAALGPFSGMGGADPTGLAC